MMHTIRPAPVMLTASTFDDFLAAAFAVAQAAPIVCASTAGPGALSIITAEARLQSQVMRRTGGMNAFWT